MLRQIIKIDEEKCTGCGICVTACHEGAIGIVNGKAKLLRDDYCDGLGDCLPGCPEGAISFEKREAAAYDEAAALRNKAAKSEPVKAFSGCPGSAAHFIAHTAEPDMPAAPAASRLSQWPVQIKLAPVNAPYFDGAHLLIAADCTAYAYGDFHDRFIKDKITLIGCPKLDSTDYSVKLAELLRVNDIASVTVVRMEVPCCGGIELAVKKALQESGKAIDCKTVTVSTDGRIL